MIDQDPALGELVDRVRQAAADGTALDIQAGNTKRFYGETPRGEPFDVTALAGISSYEPSELVVTARCGTPLRELEAALAERGQCLPFEPPHFGASATVGGMVAAGLAGPARAASGGVRDFVLGVTLLNGRAEVVSFGGQVMKNVAGYDVSRLLAGSLGTLGVICEVSLKVLPVAPASVTLRFELDQANALDRLHAWGGKPLPLNASAWWSGMLVVRLRGASAAVDAACKSMGGERVDRDLADSFWAGLREHTDEYFEVALRSIREGGGARLWRLSVPQTSAPLPLDGDALVEWGGAQRWLCTAAPPDTVREAASRAGGHATLFRGHDKTGGVFTPLRPPLDRIHRELKKAFDPAGILNPGRLVPGPLMGALRGFAWLLACQSAGEAIARLAEVALPGPVLGMLLLLIALQSPAVRVPVGAAADALLNHLSLLFVPVGVGVMTHLALISEFGLRMLFTVVLSTFAGMAVSAWVLHVALGRGRGGERTGEH